MQSTVVRMALTAAVGALIGGVLQTWFLQRQNQPVKPLVRILIALLGMAGTFLYFEFGPKSYGLLVPLQYAIFATLLFETAWEEIENIMTGGKPGHPMVSEEHQNAAQVGTGFSVALPIAGGVLLLNGWVAVLITGCFGALLTELDRIRRRRKPLAARDYFWSTAVVVTSGIVTILHGVNHVNALTAAQLGAFGPLVVRRVRL